LLLGVQDVPYDESSYASSHVTVHKDSQVVLNDMERSLWSLTPGWSDAARAERRAALRRVLDAVVAGNSAGVHYYQGLHDVAAVLLFVCGEATAYRLLSRLAVCHLRDCTRPTMAPTLEVVGLVYPILRVADPELHAYLVALGVPPHFALSWAMTWFAHDVPSLRQCARLFDLFISCHPLMPLYVAAVAMRAGREAVLACGPDGAAEAYHALNKMRFLQPGQLSADELAREAAALYQIVPPSALARRREVLQLLHSTSADAYLEGGRWQVPDTPRPQRSPLRQDMALASLPGKRPAAAAAVLATLLATGAGTIVGAALMLLQLNLLAMRHPYS
jgi:hypothetical protein